MSYEKWKTSLVSQAKSLCRVIEKLLDVLNLPSNAGGRQALQKTLPITLRHDPRVEDREHAAIGRAADQSAQPLLQRDDRRRHRIAVETVAAVIVYVTLPRADHRVGRHGERKLINDHPRQGLAAHVNSLPETRSGEQDGVRRRAEFVEDARTRAFALHQDREINLELDHLAQRLHLRIAGAKHEGAPLAGV